MSKPFNPVVEVTSRALLVGEEMEPPAVLRELHAAYLELKRRVLELEAENRRLEADLQTERFRPRPHLPPVWPTPPRRDPYLVSGPGIPGTLVLRDRP